MPFAMFALRETLRHVVVPVVVASIAAFAAIKAAEMGKEEESKKD